MIKRKQAYAFALSLAAGCAASTQMYGTSLTFPGLSAPTSLLAPPTASQARLVVMRRNGFLGSAIGFEISDNGRAIGKIGPGGVLTWDRDSGQVVIGSRASNQANLTIASRGAGVYFVEVWANWGAGFNSAACEMRLLTTEEGQALLAALRPPK